MMSSRGVVHIFDGKSQGPILSVLGMDTRDVLVKKQICRSRHMCGKQRRTEHEDYSTSNPGPLHHQDDRRASLINAATNKVIVQIGRCE